MKKKLFITFISLLLIAACAAVGIFFWWNSQLSAPSTDKSVHSVLVKKGSSAEQIAVSLKEAGVIKNEFVFKLYVRLTKAASSLPVGEFQIPGNLSVQQVIEFLKKGPQEVWVTVPEGLRREQLPSRFVTALGLSGEKANTFTSEFLSYTANDEGYLYPETYLIPKETTAAKAATLMKNTFQKKFGESFTPSAFSLKEVVTLASLLERETRNITERPDIAAVFLNRIAIGMPLQVDASVQYAKANLTCARTSEGCSDWWPTVYLDDYKLEHPFNTYKINGIPPAPIANPSISSLQAIVSPAKNNYLFYIHDKQGIVHFAKTLDEHNANVQKYLR